MKPVEVSTVIHRPIAEIYAHLDVLANHEAFTDHFVGALHGGADLAAQGRRRRGCIWMGGRGQAGGSPRGIRHRSGRGLAQDRDRSPPRGRFGASPGSLLFRTDPANSGAVRCGPVRF